ncbi:MAG TPA: hypothetical protein VJA26_06955 [Gammaproteobacteria bacterium]|nr:hypothetical protein [Gammaproteobacteria bacterium]
MRDSGGHLAEHREFTGLHRRILGFAQNGFRLLEGGNLLLQARIRGDEVRRSRGDAHFKRIVHVLQRSLRLATLLQSAAALMQNIRGSEHQRHGESYRCGEPQRRPAGTGEIADQQHIPFVPLDSARLRQVFNA